MESSFKELIEARLRNRARGSDSTNELFIYDNYLHSFLQYVDGKLTVRKMLVVKKMKEKERR